MSVHEIHARQGEARQVQKCVGHVDVQLEACHDDAQPC